MKLSQRYVPARQLPDKAVSLLDTACARVAVSQHATPAAGRGPQAQGRAARRRDRRSPSARRTATTRTRRRIAKLEEQIAEADAQPRRRSHRQVGAREGRAGRRSRSRARCWREARAAGERGRRSGRRRAPAVARRWPKARRRRCARPRATSRWCSARSTPTRWPRSSATGPASRSAGWSRTRSPRCSTIADQLKKRVVGQDHAMDAIAKRIQTSRAKLDNPNKPVGVFMLCGPSGRRQDRDRARALRAALLRRRLA